MAALRLAVSENVNVVDGAQGPWQALVDCLEAEACGLGGTSGVGCDGGVVNGGGAAGSSGVVGVGHLDMTNVKVSALPEFIKRQASLPPWETLMTLLYCLGRAREGSLTG